VPWNAVCSNTSHAHLRSHRIWWMSYVGRGRGSRDRALARVARARTTHGRPTAPSRRQAPAAPRIRPSSTRAKLRRNVQRQWERRCPFGMHMSARGSVEANACAQGSSYGSGPCGPAKRPDRTSRRRARAGLPGDATAAKETRRATRSTSATRPRPRTMRRPIVHRGSSCGVLPSDGLPHCIPAYADAGSSDGGSSPTAVRSSASPDARARALRRARASVREPLARAQTGHGPPKAPANRAIQTTMSATSTRLTGASHDHVAFERENSPLRAYATVWTARSTPT